MNYYILNFIKYNLVPFDSNPLKISLKMAFRKIRRAFE